MEGRVLGERGTSEVGDLPWVARGTSNKRAAIYSRIAKLSGGDLWVRWMITRETKYR